MILRVRQCYHDITSTRVKDNVQDFPPCRSVSWDQHREELPFRRTHRATKASSDVTMAGVLSRILSLGRKVMADVGPVGIYSLQHCSGGPRACPHFNFELSESGFEAF